MSDEFMIVACREALRRYVSDALRVARDASAAGDDVGARSLRPVRWLPFTTALGR